jgi:hypothetical protein
VFAVVGQEGLEGHGLCGDVKSEFFHFALA